MPAIFVGIWEGILELAAFVARLGPWLFGTGGVLVVIRDWFAVNIVNAAVRLAIAIAVTTAWGVFLAFFTLTLGGYSLTGIFTANPLTGLPKDMYVLFCAVFPFSFFVRLSVAYILWNLTFQQAALVMTKAVRFLFGG